MNSTAHEPETHRPRPEAGLRDASLQDLFIDCCRLGPAPTRDRELFVHAVTLALIALVFVVVKPAVGFMIAAVTIIAIIMGIRWAIGARTRWVAR